ncbi:TetR family transcriptional regulator [Eubacterium sp.]
MPASSVERTNSRKEEIISACEKLYKTKSFKEITIKEIGNIISFSRTSIYNYYETKEEIFLAILTKEYEEWISDLNKIIETKEQLNNDEMARAIAETLDKRHQLLKILSMNHYDLEENSRIEMLTEFKITYGRTLKTMRDFLTKFRPDMDEQKKDEFIYAFLPFMFGIYPYTVVTEKQKLAMENAGVSFIKNTVYDLTYEAVKKLLN